MDMRRRLSLFQRLALVLTAFAGGSGCPHLLAEEQARITYPPMSQDAIDRFRDSLKNGVPLVSIPPRVTEQPPSNIVGLWSGTQADVLTDIGEITLRFRPTTEALLARTTTSENASEGLLEHFDVRLSCNPQEVRFLHSAPLDARDVGGFKAKIKGVDKVTRVKVIDGQRQSLLYIGIPWYKDAAEIWGVYICPRTTRYEDVGRTGTRVLHLEQSPYDLSEVSLSLIASGSATYEAARGKVRAAAKLELSSELPEAVTSWDESIASVAEPKVTYRPKFPFDFFRFAPNSDIQQGVNVVVELQNGVGRFRRQNTSHVLSIHKSNEPSPVPVVVKGMRPKRDSGDCYIVQVQKYSWFEYGQSSVSF